MKEWLKSYTVDENATLKEAMSAIDNSGLGHVLVLSGDKLVGVVSDGEIRRALIKGEVVSSPVNKIMNTNFIALLDSDTSSKSKVHEVINNLKNRLKTSQYIPLVDKNNTLIDFAYIKGLQQHGKLISVSEVSQKEHVKAKWVLIIGGAGYLGSILARKLLSRGYMVRVFDIFYFTEKPLEEIKGNPNLEIIRGDMRNIAEVNKALVSVDAVVLLAGIVGDPACKLSPEETLETNYLATKMVAEACKYHQINRFVFASSASVYGVQEGVVDENSPLNPVSLYARSKIMMEEAILSIIDENFAPTMLRMGTLYGYSPRMRFDLVINTMTLNAFANKKITVHGGKQWRPFLHVDDAAEAYISVLEAPLQNVKGQIFNVSSDDHNCMIGEVAEMVKKKVPDAVIETVAHEVDTRNYRLSAKKIETLLGFKAVKSIPNGIHEIREALVRGEITNPRDRVYYNS